MKVNIPNPCSEDWNKMKIGVHSRFCDSCAKNVMDFTTKTRQEILEYLLENHGKRVCGRVAPNQLDFSHSDILVTIKALTNKHKDTNLPFYLLTIGALMLSSCDNPADKIDSSVKIETTSDTCFKQPPLQEDDKSMFPSVKDLIFIEESNIVGEFTTLGFVEYQLTTPPPIEPLTGDITIDEPERYPDKMPEFVGGIDSLMHYIEKTINYPTWERKQKIEGTVYVEFVVDEKGKVTNPQIIESVEGSKHFDKEVLRMVKKMPNWIPGSSNGKNVRTVYRIPVQFKL